MTPAALTTRFGRTATPTWLQRSAPNLAATLTHGRKPAMPPARYALLPKIDNITKPKAFGSLALLCAAIERERAHQALHLVEVEDIEFRDIGGLHRGVQVWTLDLANEKDRMLGYAWLDGAALSPSAPAPVIGSADPTDIAIGARIRARREALRITQAQLAAGAGVTFQQVQKYERGVNRVAAARLLQIAAVLKTTGADLLGELEDVEGEALTLAQPGVARLLASFRTLPEASRNALLAVAEGMVH